jgi:hypothetical protein
MSRTKEAETGSESPRELLDRIEERLTLLDLALTGLTVKCESGIEPEQDIGPILHIVWDAQDGLRRLDDLCREKGPALDPAA